MVFADRDDAGRRLAARLGHLRGEPVVVVGLPRGGVPVAVWVARALGAPLDVIVVRKLGVPFQPELGMGAVGEDGVRVLNPEVMQACGVSQDDLAAVQAREQAAVEAQAARYRARRPRQPLAGRVAVVVDDGIATGSTARTACQIARALGAARVVLAVPVAPPGWQARSAEADEMICVDTPRDFFAIGQFYARFPQVSDEEVIACLERAAAPQSPAQAAASQSIAAADPPGRDEEVEPEAGVVRLEGYLTVPQGAPEIVVFVHGSGSSRHSPRNRHVAAVPNDAGLGTLLFDLLTPEEELDRANVFDIGLLAGRLAGVTSWLRARPRAAQAAVGYFGASTGAAAALWAAAEPGAGIAAVCPAEAARTWPVPGSDLWARMNVVSPRGTGIEGPRTSALGGRGEMPVLRWRGTPQVTGELIAELGGERSLMVHAQLGGERAGVETGSGFEEQRIGFCGKPDLVSGSDGQDYGQRRRGPPPPGEGRVQDRPSAQRGRPSQIAQRTGDLGAILL